MRANELYLAHFIAKVFYKSALPEVTIILSEKAEKYFQGDIALKLLSEAEASLNNEQTLMKN